MTVERTCSISSPWLHINSFFFSSFLQCWIFLPKPFPHLLKRKLWCIRNREKLPVCGNIVEPMRHTEGAVWTPLTNCRGSHIDLPLQDSEACSGWNSQNKFLTESIIPLLACTVHVLLVNAVHICLDSYVRPKYFWPWNQICLHWPRLLSFFRASTLVTVLKLLPRERNAHM